MLTRRKRLVHFLGNLPFFFYFMFISRVQNILFIIFKAFTERFKIRTISGTDLKLNFNSMQFNYVCIIVYNGNIFQHDICLPAFESLLALANIHQILLRTLFWRHRFMLKVTP